MTDTAGFAHEIAQDQDLKLVDEVIVAAWFLCETQARATVGIDEVLAFLTEWGVRTNVNKSRVKASLRSNRRASLKSTGDIVVPLKVAAEFRTSFAEFLEPQRPTIDDCVLTSSDFATSRPYITAIVEQVNASYQFKLYDCCAVMMRRLAEVLVIDAYHLRGADQLIRDSDGNLKMMNGLINALNSGVTFRLSRNAPRYIETVKTLGDTAAHSRNYITKKKDIDDFRLHYRMLVEELRTLA